MAINPAVNPAAVTAGEWMQWNIGAGRQENVLPKAAFDGPAERNYNLKNSRLRKFLQWEEQSWGINIGWTDDAEPDTAMRVSRWFFARRAKGDAPIKYGEQIALGNGTKPSFLNFAQRNVGVNLSWQDSPSYEWQLFGGELNKPVKTGQWLVIWNVKSEQTGEPLIYFDRSAGGDLGWPTSKTFRTQIEEAAVRAAKRAAIEYLKAQTGSTG